MTEGQEDNARQRRLMKARREYLRRKRQVETRFIGTAVSHRGQIVVLTFTGLSFGWEMASQEIMMVGFDKMCYIAVNAEDPLRRSRKRYNRKYGKYP